MIMLHECKGVQQVYAHDNLPKTGYKCGVHTLKTVFKEWETIGQSKLVLTPEQKMTFMEGSCFRKDVESHVLV